MEEKKNQPTTAVAPATMDNLNAMSMYFDSAQFATAQRVCLMLASSDLVPKEYQYKPIAICNPDGSINPSLKAQDDANKSRAIGNCMIALNKAAILHSDPLTIMQNMAIVYGRPSWSATFLIGTVNSCGRYMPLKFRFGTDGQFKETFVVYKKNGGGEKKSVDTPNLTCVAYTTERGSSEPLEGTMISLRMAFNEGWIQKDGSKWLTMPKQMLMYRAAAFWVRVYAPEISQGMHTTDEVRDIQDEEYEDVTEMVQRRNSEERPAAPTFAEPQPTQQLPEKAEPAETQPEPEPAEQPAQPEPENEPKRKSPNF